MAEVGIALGANLGDRCGAILRSLNALAAIDGLDIAAVSSVYATAPWGIADQPEFLNACALARTSLPPHDLLARCKMIEASLGRTATVRWGPRVIDIDLLFYDDVRVATAELSLPHPGLFERPFVLVPLIEIMAGRRIAGADLTRAIEQIGQGPANGVQLDADATARLRAAI